jgi:hypothetical protein
MSILKTLEVLERLTFYADTTVAQWAAAHPNPRHADVEALVVVGVVKADYLSRIGQINRAAVEYGMFSASPRDWDNDDEDVSPDVTAAAFGQLGSLLGLAGTDFASWMATHPKPQHRDLDRLAMSAYGRCATLDDLRLVNSLAKALGLDVGI